MRIVDDFPLRDQPRRGFGELLQQNRRQREVAAGEHAAFLLAGERVDLRVVVVGEPGRSDNDMSAAL
jgi:hypothetical protein